MGRARHDPVTVEEPRVVHYDVRGDHEEERKRRQWMEMQIDGSAFSRRSEVLRAADHAPFHRACRPGPGMQAPLADRERAAAVDARISLRRCGLETDAAL